MLKLSKKTEYAIIALMDMAGNGAGSLYTAKEIANKYSIPREILGKVLQSLARAGLIESHQGVKGGYQLNTPLNKINFHKIINAVDGPIQLVHCKEYEEEDCCDQLTNCNIKTPMEFIQHELKNFFDNITLQDFANRNMNLQLLQIQS